MNVSGGPGSTAEAPRRVVLGRIVGVFGIRGWVKVQSYTEPVTAILEYGCWTLDLPRGSARRKVMEGRPHGRQLVALLEQTEDRTAAEQWIGATISVERAELPTLAPREYYRDDLLGFTVRTLQGVVLGRLDHFVEGPGYALMVVRGEQEHWLPAAPPLLRRVDLATREIHVDWQPPGD
jgi:16S rRNA processing protein RimM